MNPAPPGIGKRPDRIPPLEWRRWLPLGVVVAGLLAYHNSFSGPFLFDDPSSIGENLSIRQLWPLGQLLTTTMRPLTDLTFALNYAAGGLEVWGYHLLNLTIHLLAGLVLFGIVQRTLRGSVLRNRYGTAAPWLALAVAVIWTVHPLQTQSVTYIVQRAESLMGLFYLLTLYCFIRSVESPKRTLWSILAVTACALGMASKPVMATAPLVVLLYDRIFLSSSFLEAWRRRKGLYLGLAANWGLLALLLSSEPANSVGFGGLEAGFGVGRITPVTYALSQPGVILHYLRLTLWPSSLVFDYLWPVAQTAKAILLPAAVIAALVAATGLGLRRHPALGFLGVWFFLILLPSSSFIPIHDLAVEHRMYLPLAAVVTLGALGVEKLFKVLIPLRAPLRQILIASLGIGIAGLLATLTVQRNLDYQTERSIWEDTLAKRPVNIRAQNNLGVLLTQEKDLQGALSHYREAFRLNPNHPEVQNNMAAVMIEQGKFKQAIHHYAKAIELRPTYAEAHIGLGVVFAKQGKLDEAIAHYRKALELAPQSATAHNNLAAALLEQGDRSQAFHHFDKALQLDPRLANAHNNLGNALLQQGKLDEATAHYREAVRLKPNDPKLQNNLGVALARKGKLNEAINVYFAALEIDPDSSRAYFSIGNALVLQGHLKKAIPFYRQVLKLKPGDPETERRLELILRELEDGGS